jgi:lipoprotein-anchoring transpeptidase ErfK/SrfK
MMTTTRTAIAAVLLVLVTVWPAAAATATPTPEATQSGEPAVPKASGTGKRIVYDRSRQRVWLVRENATVRGTYLVSGHKYGSLPAVGRYRVQSKSRYSGSLDGAVSMEFMVRFVYGSTRWIGFHSIPVDGNGNLIQPLSQLGTPTSSGCIRQRWRNARTLYDFAHVGTRVVVRA